MLWGFAALSPPEKPGVLLEVCGLVEMALTMPVLFAVVFFSCRVTDAGENPRGKVR